MAEYEAKFKALEERERAVEEGASSRRRDDADDAATLRAELEYLQRVPSRDACGATRQLHFVYRQMGFGAEIHGLTLALTYAHETRRMVVLDPQPTRWIWSVDASAARSLGAWLDAPLSACEARVNGSHAAPAVYRESMNDTAFKAQNVEFDWHRRFAVAAPDYVYMKQSVWNRGNQHVPARYAARGLFWWRAQLAHFVFRLNAATQRAVDARLAAAGWSPASSMIGVHVRRGAKWTESPDVPLERYAARCEAIRAVDAAATHVFIATDDARTLAQLRALLEARRFHVHAQTDDVYRHDADKPVTWMDEIRRRWQAAAPDALVVLADIYALAHSRYFVGTFSSNIGRFVAELMYAASGLDPRGKRAFSLDKDWLVDP